MDRHFYFVLVLSCRLSQMCTSFGKLKVSKSSGMCPRSVTIRALYSFSSVCITIVHSQENPQFFHDSRFIKCIFSSKVCDMYGIRVVTFTLKKECHSDILMSTAIVVDELGTQGFITSFSDFIT